MVILSCLWKVLVCSQGCMQHGVHVVLADDNWGSAGCTINTGLAKEICQLELITESTHASRNLSCITWRKSLTAVEGSLLNIKSFIILMQLCTDLVLQQVEHKTTKSRPIYTIKIPLCSAQRRHSRNIPCTCVVCNADHWNGWHT